MSLPFLFVSTRVHFTQLCCLNAMELNPWRCLWAQSVRVEERHRWMTEGWWQMCLLEGPEMRFLCRELASDCLEIESLYWSACFSARSISGHLAAPHPNQRGVRFLPSICPAACLPQILALYFPWWWKHCIKAAACARVRVWGLLKRYAHFSFTAKMDCPWSDLSVTKLG